MALVALYIAIAIFGPHPEHGGVYLFEVLLLFALFGSRQFVIAVKYGYMPLSEYKTVLNGDPATSDALQMRHQLLTGWLTPKDEALYMELTDAAARHRIDLGGHTVKVPK